MEEDLNFPACLSNAMHLNDTLSFARLQKDNAIYYTLRTKFYFASGTLL